MAGSDLSDLSGIVAFFGEEGTADVLNVYGVATAPAAGDINPNQLTAIAVAGLGSGTNQLLSTHNSLFGAGYTVDDITDFDGTFLAVDLTVQNLDAFAARLQTALRDIDVFIKNSLSKVTTTALFGYEVGDEVVYRLNPGETAIAGLTSDTAYFVSAVDPTSITLVRSLDDLSTATDVQLADIGETNRVTIGLLDYDDTTTIDLSPTAGAIAFAGNEVIVDNTIVFADDHLLEAGQAVVYHTDGNNAPIGGLTDGTVYYVIIVEAGIKLAASPGRCLARNCGRDHIAEQWHARCLQFAKRSCRSTPVTGVGGDEIKFAGEHGFVNGQAVVYQAANIANTGTTDEPVSEIRPVGGLANDRLYYVIVVDETTIKLADTFADATNATPVAIPLTAVVTAADLLTITRDVLTTERSFAQNQITSNRIVFAENPGFVEGQAVVYDRGVGSTALGGLSDDHVYFVKLVAGSPNVIELAATPGGATLVLTAVGDTSTDTLAPAASFDPSSASVRNNEITFVGDHSFADGETIVYRPGDGNTAVGGLISGQSYVVIRVDDNTIQLTNEAGGSPIGIGASRTATLVPVITAPLAALVAADLNRRIEGAGLYDSVLFADIALRPETELLVAQFADGNSGLNRLLLEDAFPDALPKLPSVVPDLPAAIYYAQRFINRDGDESIISSVETVNISLTGNDGEFQVDSTFGGETNIDAGTRRQQHGHAGHVTDRSASADTRTSRIPRRNRHDHGRQHRARRRWQRRTHDRQLRRQPGHGHLAWFGHLHRHPIGHDQAGCQRRHLLHSVHRTRPNRPYRDRRGLRHGLRRHHTGCRIRRHARQPQRHAHHRRWFSLHRPQHALPERSERDNRPNLCGHQRLQPGCSQYIEHDRHDHDLAGRHHGPRVHPPGDGRPQRWQWRKHHRHSGHASRTEHRRQRQLDLHRQHRYRR